MAGVPQPEQIVTGRLFIEPMRVETAEQIGDGIWRLGLPRHRIAVEVSVTGDYLRSTAKGLLVAPAAIYLRAYVPTPTLSE